MSEGKCCGAYSEEMVILRSHTLDSRRNPMDEPEKITSLAENTNTQVLMAENKLLLD